MTDAMLTSVWEAEAKFGQARTLIRWLHDEVLPAALATPGCVGAEGFAGDDDHRVVLITRWPDFDQYEEWGLPNHPQVWRSYSWLLTSLDEAYRLIGGKRGRP